MWLYLRLVLGLSDWCVGARGRLGLVLGLGLELEREAGGSR